MIFIVLLVSLLAFTFWYNKKDNEELLLNAIDYLIGEK